MTIQVAGAPPTLKARGHLPVRNGRPGYADPAFTILKTEPLEIPNSSAIWDRLTPARATEHLVAVDHDLRPTAYAPGLPCTGQAVEGALYAHLRDYWFCAACIRCPGAGAAV